MQSRGWAVSALALALYACRSAEPTAPQAPATAGDRRSPPIAHEKTAPAQLEKLPLAASASWYGVRVTTVRWCRSPDRASVRALAIGLEIENRTDAWLAVNDRDLALLGPNDQRIARSLPPIGSECPDERLGALKPRETKRGWLYFAPAADGVRDLALAVRLKEPHGFDHATLKLGLPAAGRSGPKLEPPPPLPERAEPEAGLAPPIETAFYRVTLTGKKLCNGGRPLPDGRLLLGLEVLLENFAAVELEPSYTAIVEDESGVEHESLSVEQKDCAPKARVGATVRPGGRYRSWLWALPVPANARELTLRYRVRGSSLDAWREVRLSIGDVPAP